MLLSTGRMSGNLAPPPSGVTVTYCGEINNALGGDTSGSIDVGPAGTKLVVMAIEHRRASAPSRSITSGTIDGTIGTIAAQVGANATSGAACGIVYREISTGGTINVSVDLSNSTVRTILHIYTITGYASATPSDTATANGNDPTASIDFPSGGVVIGSCCADGNNAITWTGLATEDVDAGDGPNALRWSVANQSNATGASNVSVSVSSASTNEVLTVVAWV